MKVLITTDWYKPVINGVVTSVLNLTDGLTAMGHEVRVLTLAECRKSYREGNVTYLGSVGVGKIYPDARVSAALKSHYIKEIIDWKPDVIHSQCEFSTFIFAKHIARKCNAPLVHTYHTVYEDYTHYFSHSVTVGRFMASRFSKWILNKTMAVVTPSSKTTNLLISYGVDTPVYTVPTGLELDKFDVETGHDEIVRMREEYNIPPDARVVVYLGRLAKEKDIDKVMKCVKSTGEDDLYLLIVGGGPYQGQLEKIAHQLGMDDRTIFTGMVQPAETVKYYRMGDVFASASQSETQGLTYIEAMASGLPLLCYDDPCLDDVISDGDNGYTYKSDEEFHKKLDILLANERFRHEMGERAAKTVRDMYSMQAFAAHVAAIYASVTGQEQKRKFRYYR